ncbi:anti-sigma factor [Dyella lutea]|uniref:Anti-sigma factor n=1 Tax=Dyella lutea TaxID=2950441 RepID=A0ABT1FCX5_9GAMM|nr:anti-sigma factor [Dyella lutea]MCP1375214.1 anti-sigma factor [Dyella lutea]
MNTPTDDSNSQLRYAEYVLGVLDADARAEVERDMASSEAVATAVALWQRRLLPLIAEAAPIEPPEYVWHRIRHQLALDASPAVARPADAGTARPRWWNALRFWQGLGLGASLLAAACLALLLSSHKPSVTPPSYLASTITQGNGQVGWTATVDLNHQRVVIVPTRPQAIARDRAPELWLIPEGQRPIAVGMIGGDAPVTLPLDRRLLASFGPGAALAVSVEPPGGSPTGQPTGPVIAKGLLDTSGAAIHVPLASPAHPLDT